MKNKIVMYETTMLAENANTNENLCMGDTYPLTGGLKTNYLRMKYWR